MFKGCKSLFIRKHEDVSRSENKILEMPTLGVFDHDMNFIE